MIQTSHVHHGCRAVGRNQQVEEHKHTHTPSTTFGDSLTLLLVSRCSIILSGHFFNSGLIYSYMSLIVAQRKLLTVIFLSVFENFFSSMPDNIESSTMTVVFLLQVWRFSFELGYIRFFYLFTFLLLFLTKFNKMVLDRNYWSVFYIPMLLCFFILKSFALRLTQCNIFICIIFDC